MNIEKRDDKKRSERTEGRNSSGARNGNDMRRTVAIVSAILALTTACP